MNENQQIARIEPMPTSPSVEGMITLAIEKGASVDTLERLMAIRREVRAEQAKEAYDRALASFQAECPTIRKTAKVMNKDGRSVRYQYAPLDAIIAQVKELLQKHGFSYTVNAQAMPGNVKATCKLTHAYGHSESSEFEVPIDKDAYMNPAQQVASALTFAKRYAFCNAAGIMTGDADDDSQASFEDKKRVPQNQNQQNKSSQTTTLQPEPPKTANVPQSKPTAKPPAPAQATDKTRAWMLAELRKRFDDGPLLMFAMDHSPYAILPTEGLEDWSLNLVPTTKQALADLVAQIAVFTQVEPRPLEGPPPPAEQPHQDEQELIEEIVGDEPELEDGVETMLGVLETINEKHGKSKKGNWTLFGFKIAGVWHNSFNATLAQSAQSLKGHSVRAFYKETDRGRDLLGIERAKQS